MSDLNKVILVGRLTRDCETKTVNGNQLSLVSIAETIRKQLALSFKQE